MEPSIIIFNKSDDFESFWNNFTGSKDQIKGLYDFKTITIQDLIDSKNSIKLPKESELYHESDPWKFIFICNIIEPEFKDLFRILSIIKDNNIDFIRFREIHLICYIDSKCKEDIKDFLTHLGNIQCTNFLSYCWFLDKYNLDEIFLEGNSKSIASRLIKFLTNFVSRKFVENLVTLSRSGEPILPYFNTLGNSKLILFKTNLYKALIEYSKFRNIQLYLYLPDESLDQLAKELDENDDLKFNQARFDAFLSRWSNKVPEVEVSSLTDIFFTNDGAYDFLVNNKNNENIIEIFIKGLSKNSISYSFKPEDLLINNSKENISDHFIRLLKEGFTPEDLSGKFIDELERIFNYHRTFHFKTIEKILFTIKEKLFGEAKIKLGKIIIEILNRVQKYNKIDENLTSENINGDFNNLDQAEAFLSYILNNECNLIETGLQKANSSLKNLQYQIKESLENTREILINTKNITENKAELINELQIIDKSIIEKRTERDNLIFESEHFIKEDNDISFISKGKYTIKTKLIFISFFIGLSIIFLPFLLILLKIISLKSFLYFAGLSIIISIGYLIYNFSKLFKRIKAVEIELSALISSKEKKYNDIISDQNIYFKSRLDFFVSTFALHIVNAIENFIKRRIVDVKMFRFFMFNKCIESFNIVKVFDYQEEYGEVSLLNKDDIVNIFNHLNNGEYLFKKGNTISGLFTRYTGDGEVISNLFNPLFFDIIIDSEISGQEVPPKPEHKSPHFKYEPLSSKTVPYIDFSSKGISFEDIKQGECGDCYFLASLAAIARQQPDFLFRMIVPSETNYFNVRFYDSDGNDLYAKVDDKFWISVNDNIIVEPVYAKSGTIKGEITEIWPMIIEKAWALLNGGYEKIEGSGQQKIEYSHALTGISSKVFSISTDSNKLVLGNDIINYFANFKVPITLGSKNKKDENCHEFLVPSHMYAITEVHKNGTFNIFNPWNKGGNEEGMNFPAVDIDFIINNFDSVFFLAFEDPEKGYLLDQYLRTDLISRFGEDQLNKLNDVIEELCSDQSWKEICDKLTIEMILNKTHIIKIDKSVKSLAADLYKYSRPLIRNGWFKEFNKLNEHLQFKSIGTVFPELIEEFRQNKSDQIDFESIESVENEISFYQLLTNFTINDLA
jgi:hypothetical protein